MYTLLNNPSSIRQTNVTVFGLDYVRRELFDTQVPKYKQYRGYNPGYLKSDHILMRILQMVDVEFTGDLPTYYLEVSHIVNRIAGQMGLVTASHRGREFKDGHFYGKGVSEVYIANSNDRVSILDIWYNWRKMSPVKVLTHPMMGLDIKELDGSNPLTNLPNGALAVLEIDIPMLACQYRLWRLAVQRLDDFVEPTAHFMTQIVIPNLLDSHLDVAAVNTLRFLLGENLARGNSDVPFFVTDLWPRLEKGMIGVLDRLTKQSLDFRDVMANIPVFSREGASGLDVVQLPDIAHTNQAVWALTLARLPYIALLLEIDARTGRRRNSAHRIRIKRSILEAESGKYFSNQLSKNVSDYIHRYIRDRIQVHL